MKRRLKKIARWLDDRTGIAEMIKPLMDHPVPKGAKWSYVFGSATLFCFILQVVTGVALALMYQPSAEKAYQSLEYITHVAILGNVLRGIHYFGASAMILLVGIHMVRVYITAAYKFPREMGWISGVILLGLTLAMGFTGQLLRWDDNGVWSAVVAAEQMARIPLIGKYLARLLMAGDTIGGQTLSRFYAYHVFIFPALLFLLIGFHLMLVIRNGISEPPQAGRLVDPRTYRKWYKNMLKQDGVPFWPNAAWRDVVFSVCVIICILLLATFVGPPPIKKPPDPSIVNASPKPDWFLLWIFALFALMPRQIESYVIFLGPLLVFGGLLALPFVSNKGERSPIRRPWAVVGVFFVTASVISLLIVGFKSPWSPRFNARPLPAAVVNSNDPQVIAGARLFYDKGCLFCHQMSGHGGFKGPDLTRVGLRLSEQEMKIRIVNGSKNMPAFGQSLTKQQLEELVAFLKTRK